MSEESDRKARQERIRARREGQRPLTKKEALQEVSRRQSETVETARSNKRKKIESGGTSTLDMVGRLLQATPAAVSTLLTLGDEDYVVGTVGEPRYNRDLKELSIGERILGEDQLGFGDVFKSATSSREQQETYLAGGASGRLNLAFKTAETFGLAGDIIVDPLNLIGGAGVAADGLEVAAKGGKVTKVAERLASHTATSSYAAEALESVNRYHSALDNIVVSGADEAAEAAARSQITEGFLAEFGEINGRALIDGDTTVARSRFISDGRIAEAPTSAKGRAALATERIGLLSADIARVRGTTAAQVGNDATLSFLKGRKGTDVVRDTYIRGYASLESELRETLGITGRLWRGNLADLKSGSAFNPFSRVGSSTLPMKAAGASLPTPFSAIRKAAIESDGAAGLAAGLLQPGFSRSGRLWRAIFESTSDSAAAKARGANKFKKLLGEEKFTPELLAEWAAYPLTAMQGATVDGLIRAGGRSLKAESRRAEREVSRILNSETDETIWSLAGTDESVVSLWSPSLDSAIRAIDGAAPDAGNGGIREALSSALDAGLRRIDAPTDITLLGEELSPAQLSAKIMKRLTNDKEFVADLNKALQIAPGRAADQGITTGHLARAVLNGLTNITTAAKSSEGIFSWVEALQRKGLAATLFTVDGAEKLGSEAKLMSQLERIGLLVRDETAGTEMGTVELQTMIDNAGRALAGELRESGDSLELLLESRRDMLEGLRRRGVSRGKLKEIEEALDAGQDRSARLRSALSSALADVEVAEELTTGAIPKAVAARRALAKVEDHARKLEKNHLAILDARRLTDLASEKMAELDQVGELLGVVAVPTQKIRAVLEQFVGPAPSEARLLEPSSARPGAGVALGGRSRASALLDFRKGEAVAASAGGMKLQKMNSALALARDLFGDNIKLKQLSKPKGGSFDVSRGFGSTEGALNTETIIGLFKRDAHPRMQDWAIENGGWDKIIRDADDKVFDDLRRLAANVQRKEGSDVITGIGVTHEDLARFMFEQITEAMSPVVSILDEVVQYLDTGLGAKRLESLFIGDVEEEFGRSGQQVLQDFLQGDMGFINDYFTKLAEGYDTAIGVVGGFGDYGRSEIIRKVVADDPRMTHVISEMLRVIDGLETSSTYVNQLQEVTQLQSTVREQLESIMMQTPSIRSLMQQRGPNVEPLLASDLPELAGTAALTADEAAAATAMLADARTELRRIRARVERLVANTGSLQDTKTAILARLTREDASLVQLTDSVETFSVEAVAQNIRLSQAIELTDQAPLATTLFNSSSDFVKVRNGFEAFAADPKVRYYQNSKGELVDRSEDKILEMWAKTNRRAADWVDKLRERGVNGHLRGSEANPALVAPLTRYDVADEAAERWLQEQQMLGFSSTWSGTARADGSGVALADEGAARAFVALATNSAPASRTELGAMYDNVSDMIKAQLVGTFSFSPRNLVGAMIENLRQGANPRVTRRVLAVDSMIGTLEGAGDYLSTNPDAVDVGAAKKLIADLQDRLQKRYGDDLVGATIEARQAGVTESTFFGSLASDVIGGYDNKFKDSVREAWRVKKLSHIAEFGDSRLASSAGFTGLVAEIPTFYARRFEEHLARKVERLARFKSWKEFLKTPEEGELLTLLLAESKGFVRDPGVEAIARVDLYAQRRLAGDTAERAFNQVMDAHFDYSDLSSFDDAARKIMPFWTWRTRSLAHYSEMLMHRPAIAGTTIGLWSKDSRSRSDKTPRYAKGVGGGFDEGLGLALAITDPSADILDLLGDIQEDGLMAGITGLLRQGKSPLINAVVGITSGSDLEGIPIDSGTSIQGPLETLSKTPGGSALVDKLAFKSRGKWRWRNTEAMFAASEVFPFLAQVTKITTPAYEGDGVEDKVLGAVARLFGAPVRVVSEAEQERAQRSARYDERDKARRRKERGG